MSILPKGAEDEFRKNNANSDDCCHGNRFYYLFYKRRRQAWDILACRCGLEYCGNILKGDSVDTDTFESLIKQIVAKLAEMPEYDWVGIPFLTNIVRVILSELDKRSMLK